MTRARWTTAAFVAAVAVLVGLALPRARLTPDRGTADEALPGVFHVHTSRSDGRSSPDVIAAIAARAGLRFVVFTDHGDGTRKPDPPTYRSGVLCLDAVEISTNSGHLIALGLPQAPYPLAGDARDVLEDVHRLGGFGVAAHPDSPKADLRWRDWDVPLDGIELLNLDTNWRKELERPGWRARTRLVGALATYVFRAPETIAAFGSDGPALAAEWFGLARTRPTSIFAGADAHARLELRDADPGDNRWTLPLPGYEAVFRTLTMRVRPEGPPTGDAASDARRLLDALRRGRAYATVDAIFGPAAFEFTASDGAAVLQTGDESSMVDRQVVLSVGTNAPPTFTTVVWRDDQVLASRATAPEMTFTAPNGPAAYRVEIRATDRPSAPVWLVGNPLYVRQPRSPETLSGRVATAPSRAPLTLFDARTSASWRTEAGPSSKAALDVTRTADARALLLRFGLPGGNAFGEYAAAVVQTEDGLSAFDRIAFTARSDQPMRVSVQLRVAGPGLAADRWQRSVYLDVDDTLHVVPFADFRPVGVTQSPTLDRAHVRDVVFLVDRQNSKPGTSGRVWLSGVSLQ